VNQFFQAPARRTCDVLDLRPPALLHWRKIGQNNSLARQLDFGHLDGDVVSRPLIIKISEHSHRNDKRPDNCYCEWFHQGILQFEFFDRFT
jgi:hypothetical protein